MIDLRTEEVFSLNEAAKKNLLPARRAGKRPNVATFYRWAQRGVRGVVLETIQVGGTKCTSAEAIQRFCERLSAPVATIPIATSIGRERSIKQALQELDAA